VTVRGELVEPRVRRNDSQHPTCKATGAAIPTTKTPPPVRASAPTKARIAWSFSGRII